MALRMLSFLLKPHTYHTYLPISTGEVYGRNESCLFHLHDDVINMRHWVSIEFCSFVELSIVNEGTNSTIFLGYNYNWWCPRACGRSNHTHFNHLVELIFHLLSLGQGNAVRCLSDRGCISNFNWLLESLRSAKFVPLGRPLKSWSNSSSANLCWASSLGLISTFIPSSSPDDSSAWSKNSSKFFHSQLSTLCSSWLSSKAVNTSTVSSFCHFFNKLTWYTFFSLRLPGVCTS